MVLCRRASCSARLSAFSGDRKSTRLNSSHGYISYAVFCLKKKKNLMAGGFFLHSVYSFCDACTPVADHLPTSSIARHLPHRLGLLPLCLSCPLLQQRCAH